MGLNPNAPAWTPGLCSSGERSGDRPDRNGRTAHCVGMHHRREEGVESDGVGRLNLPVNEDKHRADKFSQRVHGLGGANPAVNTPRPSRGTRIESCDFIVLIGDP